MFREVLVPYNGGDASTRALEIGAGLAQSANAELRILAYKRLRDDEAVSEQLVHTATEIGRRYELDPHLTTLEPKRFLSDAIVSESMRRPGSIVCMAAQGRSRTQIFTGSVSSEVMLYGPRAIVLCGPECERVFFEHGGPIIAALDGTDESEAVLPVADHWASSLGLSLEVVTVLPPETEAALASAIASGDVIESGYLSGVVSHDTGLREHGATFDVLHGKAAPAILDEARARNASLIAMASQVPVGLERVRRGSVTDEVVRHSPVPVLVLAGHMVTASRRPPKKTKGT